MPTSGRHMLPHVPACGLLHTNLQSGMSHPRHTAPLCRLCRSVLSPADAQILKIGHCLVAGVAPFLPPGVQVCCVGSASTTWAAPMCSGQGRGSPRSEDLRDNVMRWIKPWGVSNSSEPCAVARGEVARFEPSFALERAASSERAQPRVPWPGARAWAGKDGGDRSECGPAALFSNAPCLRPYTA